MTVIPFNWLSGWACAECRKYVSSILNEKTELYEPTSKYWSVEHQEVYCSAACGLKKHESRK